MSLNDNENVNLSSHDKAILNEIFSQNLPSNDLSNRSKDDEENEESAEEKEAKKLEVEGVKEAEKGDIVKALEMFNQAIDVAPHRGSSYNNRAQALQLSSDVDGAIRDLNKAIELSDGKGKVACQAFTQRGIIHKFKGRENEARSDFEAAAQLGGEFAKQQAIAMNPYAALCNQMMTEVFRKVKSGEM